MGGSTGLAHGVGHPSSLGAQHTPLSSGSKGLSGSCVILHPRPRCLPVRRSCGLGPRPRPCARPARSWRFVRTMCSKWSASLRVRVALSTRGFHFNRFRGKRHRVRQVTGARTPGRLSRCYRCDNVTMIGRPAPLTQGACAKRRVALRRRARPGSLRARPQRICPRAKTWARTPTSGGVLTNGRHRKRERGTSGRWRQSAPLGCWAQALMTFSLPQVGTVSCRGVSITSLLANYFFICAAGRVMPSLMGIFMRSVTS
jgi:hypothetical protein